MPKLKKGGASSKRQNTKSGGKGKSRKAKSGKHKKMTKLELQILKYRSCDEKYKELIRRAEAWMCTNKNNLVDLLKFLTSQSTVNITYDDFKAGLSTMEAPFAKIETHIITLLFDCNKDGFIEVEDLSESLITLSLREGTLRQEKKEKINSPDRGWVHCHFYCMSVLKLRDHIFHFSKLLPLNTYTEGLVSMIRNYTQLTLPEIKLFLTSDENPEYQLLPEAMLSDLDLEGGSEWEPTDLDIYYRPAGTYTSAWPDSSLSQLTSLANDPVLWSKLIADNMVYDKLTINLNTHECNQITGFPMSSAKLGQDIKQKIPVLES